MNLKNLVFSIVVIRNEVSLNYCIIVFSSYSEMVQKTQKRMSCLDLSKNK